MQDVKEFIFNQLVSICSSYKDTEVLDNGDSIILITSIHFDIVHITVPKGNATTGWKKKNTVKNDYAISFEIIPISEEQINIDVYSQGIIANAMLVRRIEDGVSVWYFHNFNNSYDSYENAEYPYINFTNSLNKHNQFTEFIANHIHLIKDCLNNEVFEYIDDTVYDNEPKCSKHDIEGDLILTIREDTFDTLRRKAFLKLEDRIVKLDKSMLGKKIVLKEKEPNIFYPLNEEDFVELVNPIYE